MLDNESESRIVTETFHTGQLVNCNQIGHNYQVHFATADCLNATLAQRDTVKEAAEHDGWLRQYLADNGVSMASLGDEYPQCAVCGQRDIEDAGDHADSTGHWPIPTMN